MPHRSGKRSGPYLVKKNNISPVNRQRRGAYVGRMERLRQDVVYAFRLLLKDRAFTSTTLLTLALCVAANAAIFAVVNSVVLRPLPTPEADRLVLLYNTYPKAGVGRSSNGVPDYYDRLRETDVFEELALYNERGVTVGTDEGAQRLQGMIGRPSLIAFFGSGHFAGGYSLRPRGSRVRTGR